MLELFMALRNRRCCCTCKYWDGARAVQEEMYTCLPDSGGSCGHPNKATLGIMEKLTKARHGESCEDWQETLSPSPAGPSES